MSTTTRWVNFSREELQCHCGCGRMEMDPDFMDWIQELREELGFPFKVTSAYRCSAHNQAVSTTGVGGPHVAGVAIDIAVHGQQLYALLRAVLRSWGMRQVAGIGLHQRGPHSGRFIHLDWMPSDARHPRPWVWTY